MTSITPVQNDKHEAELLRKLDKGIEDMKKGRILTHEETMRILKERFPAFHFRENDDIIY